MRTSPVDRIVSLTLLPVPTSNNRQDYDWQVTVVLAGQEKVSALGATPDLALCHLAEKLNCRTQPVHRRVLSAASAADGSPDDRPPA